MTSWKQNARLGFVFVLATVFTRAAPADGQILPFDSSLDEAPGADVFVMPREAVLREKPDPNGRVVATLPAGTRLALLVPGDRWLQVSVPVEERGGLPAAGATAGYIAREVTAAFAPGEEGTRELVLLGKALGRTDTYRRLAVAFLLRASARLQETKSPEARVELLLGETAEALAASGGPFPAPLVVVSKPDGMGGTRHTYSGEAFERAYALASKQGAVELGRVRERASAGLLRARYPETSVSLSALWQETAAWLQLAESAEDARALRSASAHLGTSSLALGRYLLAADRLVELERVEKRVRSAGARVSHLLPGRNDGRKLVSRAGLLKAMRGDGSPSFPQEARAKTGVKEHIARIEGRLGSLLLTAQSCVGSARELPRRLRAVPILPVPGSLRVSPDGKTVAWIEVTAPSALLPVMASLEKDEPAREVAYLASGRPLRDRGLSHVLSSVAGFSKDGQRLGLSILAWNDTPGPEPRLSVVSVATGELLYETSKDRRSYERLLQ